MVCERVASDRDAASNRDEVFDPPRAITEPDLYCVLEPGSITHFVHSDTKWKIGPLQIEKSREHDEKYGFVTDSLVCVATQVEGSSPGEKGIMKIKLQYMSSFYQQVVADLYTRLTPWILDGPDAES
jgi:hypothetical protein